ncbi:MAG: zf-HC2 domain-containing protein [Acidobacteriota bacterium]
MSSHASADLLSAYIDRQLVADEARQLEEHLENCQQCNVRLEGLRRVVDSLQGVHQLAPPVGLEQTVARRIALADERTSLLDHFEQGMSLLNRQNPILALFGVVIALMVFIYLFSYSLHLREESSPTIPVTFGPAPPPSGAATDGIAVGSQVTVAGRQLLWAEEGLWVEAGVDAGDAARSLTLDSDDGRAFFDNHPELSDLAELGRSVVLRVEGEVLRLD